RFTGHVAFRAVLEGGAPGVIDPNAVTAFLAPDFHLVAYPLRGGAVTNLVVVTPSTEIGRRWANAAEMAHLMKRTERTAPALAAVIRQAGPWTAWPIHEVKGGRWTDERGLVLIGDAAHALTPYAAQGAAMAIEDAALLAALAASGAGISRVTELFERLRKPRIARVARRGNFNRVVWHAGGAVALARNFVLGTRGQERLSAGLDWLYGYDADAALKG